MNFENIIMIAELAKQGVLDEQFAIDRIKSELNDEKEYPTFTITEPVEGFEVKWINDHTRKLIKSKGVTVR